MHTSPTAFAADFWHRVRTTHPLSAYSGLAYLIVAVPVAAGIFLDPRTLTGAPLWLKPFKFLVSAVIYTWTFAWFLSFLDNGDATRRKWIQRLGTVTALMLIVELALILFQAARGISSHFNFTSPLNGAIFSIMAWAIITLWVANLIVILWLMRARLPDRAFAWSLRWGIVIASAGMLLGFLMTRPTPDQLDHMMQGNRPEVIGAHTVGAPDGGPGMPLTNWSSTHGDLRIPHFFGLHAMQVLPILGWFLIGRRRLSDARRILLVHASGAAYAALLGILTLQALLGQALFNPSPLIQALLGATGVAAAAVFAFALLKNGNANGAHEPSEARA